MAYNPKNEPCGLCGRDAEECVCPDGPFDDEEDYLSERNDDEWDDFYDPEEDPDLKGERQ